MQGLWQKKELYSGRGVCGCGFDTLPELQAMVFKSGVYCTWLKTGTCLHRKIRIWGRCLFFWLCLFLLVVVGWGFFVCCLEVLSVGLVWSGQEHNHCNTYAHKSLPDFKTCTCTMNICICPQVWQIECNLSLLMWNSDISARKKIPG